jgi:hypothetical protein
MKSFLAVASAAAALALGVAGAAHAAVLYTNGPIDGTVVGWTINDGLAVEDSFTLSSTSTITGVEFGAWVNQGDQPLTVDWGIETSPTFADQGTAALSTTFLDTNSQGFDVYQADFSVPSVTLGPGTYWLALQNGVAQAGNLMFWDQNSGPSSAVDNSQDSFTSESFSILGDSVGASVPEPATWAMLVLGVGMIGFAARRRSRGLAVAA